MEDKNKNLIYRIEEGEFTNDRGRKETYYLKTIYPTFKNDVIKRTVDNKHILELSIKLDEGYIFEKDRKKVEREGKYKGYTRDIKTLRINDVLNVNGEDFKIKELLFSKSSWVDIKAEYYLGELESGFVFDEKKTITGSMTRMINDLISIGGYDEWTCSLIGDNTKSTTLKFGHMTFIEAIDKIRKHFKREIIIDNKRKRIFLLPELEESFPYPILDDILNIEDYSIVENGYEYFNVIVPIGKEGITIEEVNEGKKYLKTEPYYGDKDVVYKWEDERYTNVESLKKAALEKLKKHSRPDLEITVDVVNTKLSIEPIETIDSIKPYTFYLGSYAYFKEVVILQIIETETNLNNELLSITFSKDSLDFVKRQMSITNDLEDKMKVGQEQTDEFILKQKEILRQEYLELISQTEKEIIESSKEFDRKLEEAPKNALDYINDNVGVLDGETLMMESIASKHLEALVIKNKHLESDIINGRVIDMDYGFVKKITSNVVISDLIMAGKIEGRNGFWDLTNGVFFNQNRKGLANIMKDGEFVSYDGSNPTLKIDGNSIRVYDKTVEDEEVGKMYASRLIKDGEVSNLHGHFSIRHAPGKSLGIAYETEDSSTATTYIMFDINDRSDLTRKDFPITLNTNTSIIGDFHMRYNTIHMTDTHIIEPYRGGVSIINKNTKQGMHVTQSGLLYHRDGDMFARVQLGKYVSFD